MYDELIKQLRESKNDQCYIGCFGLCGDCRIDTELKQAANAIEDLNRRIGRAIELYNRNVEKSAMYEALAGISPEPPKEET